MNENKLIQKIIIVVSVVVPVLVGVLMFSSYKIELEGDWVKSLPTFNAIINSLTSVLLVLGLVFIKKGQVDLHKKTMLGCFVLGTLFLISYVIYHAAIPSAIYGDVDGNGILSDMEKVSLGGWRGVYLVLLSSHIGLSIIVVPFVLLAFYFALADKLDKHRKLVKFTWPIWFYVSVTGVLVYLMISPYYA